MQNKSICYYQFPNGLIYPCFTSQSAVAEHNGGILSTKKRYNRQMKHLQRIKKLADKHRMTIERFMEAVRDTKWMEKYDYKLINSRNGTIYLVSVKLYRQTYYRISH